MDIWLEENGDLLVGPDGDLKLSYSSDEIAQHIMFRCKTVIGDFYLQPQCGASLESVIGEPNDEATADAMEQMIRSALTHDGLLSDSDFEITVMPVDINTIMAVINVDTPGAGVTYVIEVDLREGQVKQRRL